jgi:hypothetical protein
MANNPAPHVNPCVSVVLTLQNYLSYFVDLKSEVMVLNTFLKRENKPDFDGKTRLQDTRFLSLS